MPALRTGTNSRINLVVAAIVLAGFTQLRIASFGLSEVIIVFLFVGLWWKEDRLRPKDMVFAQFWFLTLIGNLVGLLINLFFHIDYATIESGSAQLDMLAYAYMLVLSIVFETILLRLSHDEIWTLVKRIFFTAVTVIGTLFVISRFTQTLLGFNLFYGGMRFSPLAQNPHQINVLTSTLPFIGIRVLKRAESIGSKIVAAIYISTNLVISLFTFSDTMIVVYLVCFYLLGVIHQDYRHQRKPRYLVAVLVSGVILAAMAYYSDVLVRLIVGFFEQGDAGGARFLLWRNSIEAGMRSPLFGLGPGAHSGLDGPFEGIESHQMILAMFTQAGIIGVALLALLTLRVVQSVYRDKYILIVIVGLLVSSLSGTTMRRTVWWMYLMIYYHLARKTACDSPASENDPRLQGIDRPCARRD